MQTAPGRWKAWRARRTVTALACLGAATLPVGCGSSAGTGGTGSTITDTAAVIPVATSCPSAAVAATEQVAHRIYEESAGGRIIAQAVKRLGSSAALAQAVQLNDAAGARRVLRGLLQNQIVSVRLTRGPRTLVDIKRGAGIAPVSGRLLGPGGKVVGGFTVAVQGANGYAQTTSGLTATEVLVHSGSRQLTSTLRPAPTVTRGQREVTWHGVSYRVDTFGGRAFPNRPLSISLLVPSASIDAICGPAGSSSAPVPAQAGADTLGLVAKRVYYAEHAGSKAELILGYVERSRAFREAVLAGNAAATRAAIIGFFRSHLHVVRVRVIRGGRLLVDVGGPYVLAPIPGTVRNARGRAVAHFQLAIQDDMGFMLLAHAFTGAQVLMREGQRQVMGSLTPGPASLPDRGRLVYRGTTYRVYSFDAEAFPSGPLRISLLFPTG
jgi:hypothetical protein